MCEMKSISATTTMIMMMMKLTSSQRCARMRSERWKPIPPAPTIPRMVAERVLDSNM